MANHNLPLTSSTYSNFVTELDTRLDDITLMLNSGTVTATNLPNGAVRWNNTSNKWQILSSGSWADLTSAYSININGTVGATTPTTGAFTTLSTSGVASLGANSTIGGVVAVTISGTQTLTNKTLTSPIISTISNTGTITLPTSTTTLVGRDTTDTLENKTLTAPKFVDTGYLADNAGNELIKFTVVANAVNEITVANTATAGTPSIAATGGDTNISLNLVSKGTGTIKANSIDIVNVSGTQTLTNKTLGSGTVYNGGSIGTAYGGTGNTANLIAGGIAYGETTTKLGTIAAGTAGQVLTSNGPGLGPAWVNANTLTVSSAATATSVSGTVAIANGGTGATTAAAARTNLGLVIGTNVLGLDGTGATGTWPINISGNAANGGVTSINGRTGAIGNTIVVLTSTGLWSVPAGVSRFKFTVVGGGGSGGSPAYPYCGGGGGAGGAYTGYVDVSGSTQFHATIGAGGAAIGAGNGSGANGSNSVLRRDSASGTVIATGGYGAGAYGDSTQWNYGGSGGTGSGSGGYQIGGGAGTIGGNYGGGGGGSGGSSALGGGGRGGDSAHSHDGQAGIGYGGGGGGAVFGDQPSGAGAAGVIIIEY